MFNVKLTEIKKNLYLHFTPILSANKVARSLQYPSNRSFPAKDSPYLGFLNIMNGSSYKKKKKNGTFNHIFI